MRGHRLMRRWAVAFLGGVATLSFAQEVPVILTSAGDPSAEVSVFWQRREPGRGTVRYGLTTNYTREIHDAGGVRRHRIRLRALSPGTLYHYQAASTDGFLAGDRTFRTAPGPTGGIHVVVHGDLQGGMDLDLPGAARGVVNALRGAAPDLVVNLGDMAIEDYGGMGYGTWDQFFGVATDLLDRVVFMPVPGNHDVPTNGASLIWQFFDLPARPLPGNAYSFRSGPVHFQALSSESAFVPAQTNWMMRDLQGAAYDTNVAWIIPYFHRPPYSLGERSGDDFVKTNWARLFTMYQADLVFSGHSHNYQRWAPIRDVTYVVAGGGGGRLYYSTYTPGAHDVATTCFHYVSLQVTGSVMRYRAIRSDGQVFEDLVLNNAHRKVRVAPAFPSRGGTAKVLYDAAQGPLSYSSPVYLHLGVDAFTNALVDAAMTYNAASGLWEYDVAVPADTSERIAFVFHDAAATNWDNNYTYNWQALLDDAPFVSATAAPPRLVVAGSPVITDNPSPQNNIGDNFDLVTNGMPLTSREASGFGDFGAIYFNHDATNLYVGGHGADLGGSNNVFVLFLGVDSLNDNAENLWHKSGLPQTLDQMHNLGLVEPMDIAIVYGSEWGDGPGYTNFTYGGYNFGQGVFSLSTNSSAFLAMTNARLSQFDSTGYVACVTSDDDGDDRTERWEAAIPWTALNAPGGVTSLTSLLVGGVIASRSTNGNDRYLSATHIGQQAYATRDPFGNFGYNFLTLDPVKIALEHGDEDLDGQVNSGEQAAGTDLTDAESLFKAECTSLEGGNQLLLHWPSTEGRRYTVSTATSLPGPFLPLTGATNLTPDPPINAYTAVVSETASGFFRISVQPAP